MKKLIVRFLKWLLGVICHSQNKDIMLGLQEGIYKINGRKESGKRENVLTAIQLPDCGCPDACGGVSNITHCGIHDCSCEIVWSDTGEVVVKYACCCCITDCGEPAV